MAIPKSIASIKRFGARYGRTVKHKFGAVEALQRKKYKCPFCSKQNVKRTAAGIWQCQKCGEKFASRAYTVTKRKTIKEMIEAIGAAEKTTDRKELAAEGKETAEEKA